MTKNQEATASVWLYNAHLLEQAIGMIERLQDEACASFNYGQAVGPHVRHIIEHYTALLDALDTESLCVDYDARDRDVLLQSQSGLTIAKLRGVCTRMHRLSSGHAGALGLDQPLRTRLKAGQQGEMEFSVQTSLGRELLFLSSHTVHHFALLAQYCKAAGVDLGHDFGKAPATVAFERMAA